MLNGKKLTLVTILFVLAQLLVFVTPTPALAEEPKPDLKPPVADATVLSAEQTDALAEIALQSEQYLEVGADGTLSLKVNDPAVLGVDQAFLDSYKAGLDELNKLVRAGELVIHDDLSVEWTNEVPADDAAVKGAVEAEPNWGAYPYQSGVTIHFNRHELRRLRRHGTSFATTIGGHLNRSHVTPHLTHLFTRSRNHNVFQRHRYSYGSYFYTPWQNYRSRYHYKNIYFYRQHGGHNYWYRTRAYY